MRPLGCSYSVEGGVATQWGIVPSGVLRHDIKHCPALRPAGIVRYGLCVVSALSYTHARGCAHGSLSLDATIVDASGACCVLSASIDRRGARATLVLRRTSYVSPAVAAGARSTPACDTFCYRLLCLEALARQPAWRWAADQHEGEESERDALMAGGGQAFSAAVAEERVAPSTALLNDPVLASYHNSATMNTLLRRLSFGPLLRPTAVRAREVSKVVLLDLGISTVDDGLAV